MDKRRLFSLAAVIIGSTIAVPTPASADILIATTSKICAGYEGSGIEVSLILNHGWRPSRKLHYRLAVYNPRGRRVASDQDWFFARDFPALRYTPTRAGVFKIAFATKIDAGYPDIDLRGTQEPRHPVGVWESWRTEKIRVYACGGRP